MTSEGDRLVVQTESQKEVVCPYCGSTDTEFYSLFGQQLLTMQYYCRGCHTPFEYVRDEGDEGIERPASE